MWPYTEYELEWLAGKTGAKDVPSKYDLTPELIEIHVRNGKRLQAEAVRLMTGRAGIALRSLLRIGRSVKQRHDPRSETLSELSDCLRSPLTSIRYSAQTLRDNPNLDAADRSNLAGNVLAEQARLEMMISQMIEMSHIKSHSKLWQVQLEKLNLHGDQKTC